MKKKLKSQVHSISIMDQLSVYWFVFSSLVSCVLVFSYKSASVFLLLQSEIKVLLTPILLCTMRFGFAILLDYQVISIMIKV